MKETYETICQKLISGLENIKDIPEEINCFTEYLVKSLEFESLDKEESFDPTKLTLVIDHCLDDIRRDAPHLPGSPYLPKELRQKYDQIYKNLKYLVMIVESEFDQQFADDFKTSCIAAFGEKYFM